MPGNVATTFGCALTSRMKEDHFEFTQYKLDSQLTYQAGDQAILNCLCHKLFFVQLCGFVHCGKYNEKNMQ